MFVRKKINAVLQHVDKMFAATMVNGIDYFEHPMMSFDTLSSIYHRNSPIYGKAYVRRLTTEIPTKAWFNNVCFRVGSTLAHGRGTCHNVVDYMRPKIDGTAVYVVDTVYGVYLCGSGEAGKWFLKKVDFDPGDICELYEKDNKYHLFTQFKVDNPTITVLGREFKVSYVPRIVPKQDLPIINGLKQDGWILGSNGREFKFKPTVTYEVQVRDGLPYDDEGHLLSLETSVVGCENGIWEYDATMRTVKRRRDKLRADGAFRILSIKQSPTSNDLTSFLKNVRNTGTVVYVDLILTGKEDSGVWRYAPLIENEKIQLVSNVPNFASFDLAAMFYQHIKNTPCSYRDFSRQLMSSGYIVLGPYVYHPYLPSVSVEERVDLSQEKERRTEHVCEDHKFSTSVELPKELKWEFVSSSTYKNVPLEIYKGPDQKFWLVKVGTSIAVCTTKDSASERAVRIFCDHDGSVGLDYTSHMDNLFPHVWRRKLKDGARLHYKKQGTIRTYTLVDDDTNLVVSSCYAYGDRKPETANPWDYKDPYLYKAYYQDFHQVVLIETLPWYVGLDTDDKEAERYGKALLSYMMYSHGVSRDDVLGFLERMDCPATHDYAISCIERCDKVYVRGVDRRYFVDDVRPHTIYEFDK